MSFYSPYSRNEVNFPIKVGFRVVRVSSYVLLRTDVTNNITSPCPLSASKSCNYALIRFTKSPSRLCFTFLSNHSHCGPIAIILVHKPREWCNSQLYNCCLLQLASSLHSHNSKTVECCPSVFKFRPPHWEASIKKILYTSGKASYISVSIEHTTKQLLCCVTVASNNII